MLVVLIIACILLLGSLFLGTIVQHPIMWVMSVILALAIVFVIWPKYQTEKIVARQGEWVKAQVVEVREWDSKVGDGNYDTQYEIIASWVHPLDGKMYQFRSIPLHQNPNLQAHDTVKVRVIMNDPKQYVMDVSAWK